jgi:hypothetical protein
MSKRPSPVEIVEHQLRAYNTHNIDAYCALFAHNAVLSKLNVEEKPVCGIDAIRARYTARFKNPKLHCEINARIEFGNFVIDHERVIGLYEDPLEAIAIYEVRDSLIRSIRFIWS